MTGLLNLYVIVNVQQHCVFFKIHEYHDSGAIRKVLCNVIIWGIYIYICWPARIVLPNNDTNKMKTCFWISIHRSPLQYYTFTWSYQIPDYLYVHEIFFEYWSEWSLHLSMKINTWFGLTEVFAHIGQNFSLVILLMRNGNV